MSKKADDDQDQKEITKRLDAIISILLNHEEIQKQNQLEKIKYLTSLKFTNPEIAHILNTTKGTVESQKYSKKEKK